MQASDLGLRLAVTMALCCYGGYRLDQWLDTQPIFLLVGAFVGLGGGMWSAIKAVNRITAGRAPRTKRAVPPATGPGDADGKP